MSLSNLVPSSRTNTNTIDQYDHEINLLDSTTSATDTPGSSAEANVPTDIPRRRETDETFKRLVKGGTLREELARRKYARWQDGRDNGAEGPDEPSENGSSQDREGSVREGMNKQFTSRTERLKDKLLLRPKKSTKVKTHDEYEVDILYENQRGSFLCGIPLYSSKSLLNFDPSAWQTSAFRDSPVNITNAQVPDPSWTWAWKSWYVDMSHDVDEEGWEYSFSFQQGFSWHGSHPWFHSFVRRRRWLRKRVKIRAAAKHGLKGALSEGHTLNLDYFTIHAARRDRSRESSVERSINNRSSYLGSNRAESDTDEEDAEISDISTLIKALKKATIDRKKIEIIQNFLEHGGENLHYLPEYMEEIMSMFLYQTSRRQFLEQVQNIRDSNAKPSEEDRTDGSGKGAEDVLISKDSVTIQKIVEAANEHVKDLAYWSDFSRTRESVETQTDERRPTVTFEKIDQEIRGIPEDAAIDQAPGLNVYRPEDGPDEEQEPRRSSRKGKEKAS